MTLAIPKLVAATLAMLITISTAQAAEIKLIAANALKEAVLELVPEFEKRAVTRSQRPGAAAKGSPSASLKARRWML